MTDRSGAWQHQEQYDAFLADARRKLLDHGLTVQAVGGDSDTLPFAYTAGLGAHDHPELMVLSLPPQTAHAILNDLGRRVITGTILRPGDRLDGILHGYQIGIAGQLSAKASNDYPISIAKALLPHSTTGVFQVVYPDADHRFPGEDRYTLNEAQPLLTDVQPPYLS